MSITETWIPWAIRAPIPSEGYDGYDDAPDRELSEILYIVNHSAEGWKSYLKQGHRPGEQASWTFSVMVDGQLYQHAPLEALTYGSGSYEANRDGIVREHEGVKPFVITPAQVATDRRLDGDLADLCPNLRPLVKGFGYREHSELTGGATSCPSGRIQPLYDAVMQNGEGFLAGLTEDQQDLMRRQLADVYEKQYEFKEALKRIEGRVLALATTGGASAAAIVALLAEKLSG